MIIIGLSIIVLLIFICIERSQVVTNIHSANLYLNDIRDKLNEINMK